MAINLALLSFEFESFEELSYDSTKDHDFSEPGVLLPNNDIQPVVEKAFTAIKQCLADSISRSFHFGQVFIQNLDNFLHIGSILVRAEVQHTDNSTAQTSIIVVTKFYRLEPTTKYKVTIDIEQMPSSSMNADDPNSFGFGFGNEEIDKLFALLNMKFNLSDRLESVPLIKRGRLDMPHYLVSSDNRVLEYDFDQLLFHQKSEFQDIKIVSSPSLGNTLLLDNLQNLAEVDEPYTYALMDRGNVSYKDKEILILGGGDGGLLWELLKESPKFVCMAEIDPVVIEACRRHLKPCGEVLESLEGKNYSIVLEDCMKVLRQSIETGKKYDVIFNDLTDIPVCKREESLTAFESSAAQKDNPWHFIEVIFNLSFDCLKDDGLYMSHTTGKGNVESLKAYEQFLDKSRVQMEYASRTCYVPSFMEIWVFYTVKRKKMT